MKFTRKQFWSGLFSAIFIAPLLAKLVTAKDIVELKPKEKPKITRVVGIVIDGHGQDIVLGYKDEESIFFDGVIKDIVYSDDKIKIKITVNDLPVDINSKLKNNDTLRFSVIENNGVKYVKIKVIILQEVDV